MSKHSMIDPNELSDLYLNKHWTMQEIGDHYGKTRQRISQLIKQHDIDTSTAESFEVHCAYCDIAYNVTRRRFRINGVNYCSQRCYHAHRASISTSKPSRQGQRLSRTVMAKHLNRELEPTEVVHHVDGDCDNTDINNLILFISQSEHLRFHHQIRITT